MKFADALSALALKTTCLFCKPMIRPSLLQLADLENEYFQLVRLKEPTLL